MAHATRKQMHAPHSRYFASGKFGRLFPTLPPLRLRDTSDPDLRQALVDLGAAGGIMDPGHADNSGQNTDNKKIPAGFGFLGQFIDHDITLDVSSSLERQNDPEGIENFRTPVLELDSVYGSGPEASPYLYDSDGVHLLVEERHGIDQLPRTSVNAAIIGDPRNDENLIISRLQLAFIQFHNAVVDALAANGTAGEHLFEEAQRLVRWHYQWIVLHEFLPLTIGKKLTDDIYTGDCTGGGRLFYHWRHEPFIPIEFAVAAYRFGHSQIPGQLKVNDEFNGGAEIPLFDPDEIGDIDPDDLSGFGVEGSRRYVDWKYFFKTSSTKPQPTKHIDRILAAELLDLPFVPDPARSSLAVRNLLRGHSFGLPSGQAVACAMCIDPLSKKDLEHAEPFSEATPLWYYILEEARVVAGGEHLGPVGGRIVGEVLIGLLEGDRMSFVRQNPKWTPEDEGLGTTSDFGMADLLKFADLA
jgi:hypothetical protein